ncbi:AbrB/MazE/SpoVT family DNA-binding domain-containing protein [Tenuibacillus multivorans]|uniref:SpoVT-AbrB domain-containing protein n=1 Tax=Tenuibacillus multivorans TaxID=237069 RepID=A0A1G9WYW8_9BACI|nr:hypothetical protein [Tenuibacillus multivorans]GEL77304.1 hypothetical protein TMU01_15390 [Tenuibacillus multivorans]SDM89431.1 hypothetical protein SAMN05216498_0937 [Tenuibacillus multivorans]
MTKTVTKWDNSLGIRLPQAMAKNKGLKDGSQVHFEEVKKGIDFQARPMKIVEQAPSYTTNNCVHFIKKILDE